jgi:hypothetical protein
VHSVTADRFYREKINAAGWQNQQSKFSVIKRREPPVAARDEEDLAGKSLCSLEC